MTGHRSSFWIKLSFGIGHPPPICQMQCICVGESSRVPNLQTEFNYLDLFKSYGIFSDFVVPVVPALSPSSLSSPCRPRRPHVVPIAPRRSLCGPHGLWSPWSPPMLSPPMLSPSSPSSPRHPRRPHIIPVIPMSSPHRLEGPQIIPNCPDSHPTHPPPPWGWGGLESLKIQ